MKRVREEIERLYIDGKIDEFIEAALELEEEDVLRILAEAIKGEEGVDTKLESIDLAQLDVKERSLVGLIYTIRGALGKAEEVLEKCIEEGESWSYFRYANVKLLEGDLEKAKEYLLKGLEKEEKAEAYNNLGYIYKLLDDKEQMYSAYLRAWELKPHDFGIAKKAIEAIKDRDGLEEFQKELEERIEKCRDDKEKSKLIVQLGIVKYEEKRRDEALKHFLEAVTLNENDENIRKVFIDYFLKEERYWVLGNKLKEWVEKYQNIDEHLALIECRIKVGFLEKAYESLQEVRDKIRSQKLEYELLMAQYHMENKEFDRAKEILEELHAKYPHNQRIAVILADLYKTVGELDRSLEILEKTGRDLPGILVRKIDLKKKLSFDEIKRLEEFFEREEESEQKSSIGFALAEAYDKLQEYGKAAEFLKKANEEIYPTLGYSIEEFRKEIDEIIRAYSWEWVEGKQNRKRFEKRPIFIVGMPRSGTTMLEQIFAAHDKVFGAGELSFVNKVIQLASKIMQRAYPYSFLYGPKRLLKEAGEYYIELTQKLYSFSEPVFVDKMPHNFMHCALLVTMFADSKVIFLRRDYRSIALSNYFQNFASKKGTLGYAFDLKAMGEHIKDYLRVMDFYKEILPKERFREFWYEDLVLYPKEKIPEVLEFCELDFTEEVLEFYKNKSAIQTASVLQVRNPIYTKSIEKWKKYEELLKPVMEIVGEKGIYNG